jgi:hypothetical protein
VRYGDPSSGYCGHQCLVVVMWSVGGWSVGGLRGEGEEDGCGQQPYGAGYWICSGSLQNPTLIFELCSVSIKQLPSPQNMYGCSAINSNTL